MTKDTVHRQRLHNFGQSIPQAAIKAKPFIHIDSLLDTSTAISTMRRLKAVVFGLLRVALILHCQVEVGEYAAAAAATAALSEPSRDVSQENSSVNAISLPIYQKRRSHTHRSCGTHDPSDIEIRSMNIQVDEWASDNTWALMNMTSNSSDTLINESNATGANITVNNLRLLPYQASATTRTTTTIQRYTIPVFLNVLALSETHGTLTNNQIKQIVRLLNAAYTASNFQFVLQGIQRRTGAFWHNCTVNNQNEWKAPLYVSGSNALNIYYCRPTYLTTTGAAVESQGFSSWPTNANNIIDGLVIPHSLYYGLGGMQQYTIHEIGHWMGLLHTYAGGCTAKERVFENMVVGDGDGVSDTPAHASQTLDVVSGLATCWQNVTVDTCDDVKNPLVDPGTDPVTNCAYTCRTMI